MMTIRTSLLGVLPHWWNHLSLNHKEVYVEYRYVSPSLIFYSWLRLWIMNLLFIGNRVLFLLFLFTRLFQDAQFWRTMFHTSVRNMIKNA